MVTCPRLPSFRKPFPEGQCSDMDGAPSTSGTCRNHGDQTGRPCACPVGGGPSAGPLGPLSRRPPPAAGGLPGTSPQLPSGMCRHCLHCPTSRGNPDTHMNSCTGPVLTPLNAARVCRPSWDCAGKGPRSGSGFIRLAAALTLRGHCCSHGAPAVPSVGARHPQLQGFCSLRTLGPGPQAATPP